VFDKLIQALVVGCGYREIADATLLDGPTSRPAVGQRTVRAELGAEADCAAQDLFGWCHGGHRPPDFSDYTRETAATGAWNA
jgi:hypothetical protein